MEDGEAVGREDSLTPSYARWVYHRAMATKEGTQVEVELFLQGMLDEYIPLRKMSLGMCQVSNIQTYEKY